MKKAISKKSKSNGAVKEGFLSSAKKALKWLDPFTYVDSFVMPIVNPKSNPSIELLVNVFFAAFFAIFFYSLAGFLLSTEVPGAIVFSYSMVPVLSRGDFIALQGVSAENLNAPVIDLPFPVKDRRFKEYAASYCGFSEAFASKALGKQPAMQVDGEGGQSQLAPCDSFLTSYLEGEIPMSSFSVKKIVFRDSNSVLEIGKTGDIVLYYSDLSGKQIIHRAVAKIKASDGVFVLTKGDSGSNPIVDQDYFAGSTKNAITSYAIPAGEIKGRIILKIPIIGYVKILLFDDLPNLIFGCRDKRECYFP